MYCSASISPSSCTAAAGVCGRAAAEAEDAERGGSSSDSAVRAVGGAGRVTRVRVEDGLVVTFVPPAVVPPANLKLLLVPLSSTLAAARWAALTAGGGAFVLPNAALCPAFFPFVTPILVSPTPAPDPCVLLCGSGLCACPFTVDSDDEAVPARPRCAVRAFL